MKTELIEKLKDIERKISFSSDLKFFGDEFIIREAIQVLEKQESEQVSAEEYKTQLVVPIEIRNKEYCDLNGKVIPTEFILGKEHFFYGGYGYIVLQTYASKQSDAVEWISVEDRLPSDREYVIVNCEYGVTGAKFVYYEEYNHKSWYINISVTPEETYRQAYKVTHWMPLPTPPNK